MANLKNTQINDTGFLQLPEGSTTQRPSSATNGEIRYNSELKYVEQYDAEYDLWLPVGFNQPTATGGTVTNITQGGVDYRVHSFTDVGTSTFDVTSGGSVEYLIVGGGGAGGGADDNTVAERAGGGGGGSGVIIGNDMVTTGQYSVEVGAGGAWSNGAQNGNPSSFLGQTALGGGNGDDSNGPSDAGDGSSGGGGSRQRDGGSGTPGQGFDGSDSTEDGSGAGGGAGGPGKGANQPGGPGIFSGITGTILEYGFGGKGAGDRTGAATPAIDNRGAGAEGQQTGTGSFPDGVSGGSGIVVVRYKNG